MSDFDQIIAQAKRIEEKLSAYDKAQAEGKADLEKIQKGLAELGEQQAALGRKLVTLQQESTAKATGEQKAASLGRQFIESSAYADLISGKIQKAVLAAASPVATPAGSVPTDYQGVKAEPQLPNSIVAAFPHVSTTSNSISYLKEKAFTNSAAEVAEGASKPESKMEFEAADAPVRTIAHYIRVTKQLAEDAPALAAYINSRMQYGLARRIEKQLLLGDGTGDNLKGVLTTGNYTAHGFTEDTMPSGSTVLDLIRRCAATMRKSGYQPNAVFLSPMDFDTLRGMKDQNGNYIMGSPLQAGTDIRPWGLQVVESAEMTEGKFLVADTRMGATIYDRTAPVLEMFEQDADNVTKNLYTVRVEQRMAFAVETANAFIGGDLAIGKAATPPSGS